MIGSQQDFKTGNTALKLRNCIHSAASVLSAASTIRSGEAFPDDGAGAQSLDGLAFPHPSDHQADLMAWINSSSTVDIVTSTQRPLTPAAPSISVQSVDHHVDTGAWSGRNLAPRAHMQSLSPEVPAWDGNNYASPYPPFMSSHQPDGNPQASISQPGYPPNHNPGPYLQPHPTGQAPYGSDSTVEVFDVSNRQQATSGFEEVAPQQTIVAPTHKRSRSRLSRLFSARWGSGAPSSSEGKQRTALPPVVGRRKLCFVGDGACGKTCLLV